MKKVSSLALLFLVLSICTYSVAPKAKAQLLVSDPAVLTAVITDTSMERTKEDILDGIAWTVAKVAVQSMTRSIVNWINSGYQGEPAFSQNLNRDMRQMGDALANAFIAEAANAVLSSELIAPLAQNAVAAYYLLTSEDALAQRLKYTLADYTLDSAAYIRGDWSKGGLSGWYGLTFRPENDPRYAAFIIQENLFSKIDAQMQQTLAEFGAGNGFLSWRGECAQTAGGQAGNTAMQQCIAQNEAGGPVQDCFALYGGAGASLSDADACVAYDVLTPGSVVEQQLVENLGSGVRQLELADSINEIISAVVVQMVNQVLGGGGLSGLSAPRPSGGRPIDTATTPTGPSANITGGFESLVRGERTKWGTYKKLLLQHKRRVL